jgi:hypothetical protein
MKRTSPLPSPAAEIVFCLVTAGAALLLAACGSGGSSATDGPVYEQTYAGDLPDGGAIEQETPNGGYRTVVGDPVVILNGDVEPESLLPYGGGEEGLRQAEDESPSYRPEL